MIYQIICNNIIQQQIKEEIINTDSFEHDFENNVPGPCASHITPKYIIDEYAIAVPTPHVMDALKCSIFPDIKSNFDLIPSCPLL